MEKLKEKFIIDKSGKKTAIILPLKDYKELLEDIHDLAVIAERKEESTISFDELKRLCCLAAVPRTDSIASLLRISDAFNSTNS